MISILLIAFGLSMDAFSLALAYGMNKFLKDKIIKLSLMVGIFHFIMPLFGHLLGDFFLSFIKFDLMIIASIVFMILGVEMFIDTFKEENKMDINNNFDMFIFSLAVSIDSLGVGLGIKSITSNYFLCFFMFSLFSFLFTLIGLLFGKYLGDRTGKYSTLIGSIILFGFGIYCLF